jgi:predicted small metal-binding protein
MKKLRTDYSWRMGDDVFAQNVGKHLQDHMASQHKMTTIDAI